MALTARERVALVAAAGIGLAAGLGVFTFGYARGASYLTNDPAACANCHIMSEHFAAWQRGSHRAAAACNDCHTPHNFVGKYATKARNGFWHSFYFTTGRYPDPLRITERNRRITEQACRYCHADIVDAIDPAVAARQAARRPGDDRHDRQPALASPIQRASVEPVAAILAAALATPRSIAAGGPAEHPLARETSAHPDPRLSCIRCHTYVGHWVR